MNYRHAALLSEKSISAAGVEEIDLNFSEPISRIEIRHQITGADAGMSGHSSLDMTKIELVDGSDVLHSLNGSENQALAIYSRKVPTMNHGQLGSGNSICSIYGIDFGRFLYDKELAFLPKRFSNPKLRLTHTLTNCSASATASVLEVKAHIFDEKTVNPMGFLMAKEHINYTQGADGSYEYVELPRDYVLRQLLVRPYYIGYEPWYNVDEIRLDEDNMKRVPFDVNVELYYRVMKGQWPMVQELIQGVCTTSSLYWYLTATDYWASFAGIDESQVGALYLGAVCRAGKLDIQSSSGAQFRGLGSGYLPNHCIQFPTGLQDEIADWYDTTKLGSSRLRIKAHTGGTSSTCQVVTEQLRRY